MSVAELAKDFQPKNLILWVGAGVSYPDPTSLPLAIPLTTFALRECCGETTAANILRIWERANASVCSPANQTPLGRVPRLELVLGDLEDVRAESKSLDFDFLRGFKIFTSVPFNQNHLFLAEILGRGATIITTNFDTCIEDAYRWLTRGADRPVLVRQFGTPYYRPDAVGTGRVWHVHGTAEDITSLGATIRTVKEGLPANFRNWLDAALQEPTLVVFLGYGAGDSFDINFYFAEKDDSQFAGSVACFVQHPGYPLPSGASLLVRPFGKRVITSEDTTEVLRSLSSSRLPHPPSAPIAWQDTFLREAIMNARDEVKAYLICKIAFSLGVNVGLLDERAYRGALRMESHFRGLDFNRTLAYVCRVQGKSSLEKQHDLKSKRGATALLGYYYSKGRVRRALKYAKTLNELFNDAHGRGGELGWETYTSMSAHCRNALNKYLLNPFISRISLPRRVELEKLVELTDLLSQVPLRNVRYLNQVATAARFNFQFKALLSGVKDEQAIQRVLSLYGEGASVAGFISTYRDVAAMHYLLYQFHRAGELAEAVTNLDRSLRLATVVGDVPSIRRAKKLKMYLSWRARWWGGRLIRS